MKLDEVSISKFQEYDDKQIKQAIDIFINKGVPVISVEGDKFILVKVNEWYGLQRKSDKKILGWISVIEDKKYFKIKMFYILPEYRKKTAGALVLFHSVKELLNKPLLIDDVISYETNDILSTLSDKKFKGMTPTYINKKTGEKTNNKDLFDENPNNYNIVLERDYNTDLGSKLVGWPLPGQNSKNLLSYTNNQCFTWFEHLHNILSE